MSLYPRTSRYVLVRIPGHRRADSNGYALKHVVIAEAALGKPLPAGAQIHHVDDDSKNNAPSNLVMCQDAGYHKLLHARARIVRAGGNPNTHRLCGACRLLKPIADFNASSAHCLGTQTRCRKCQSTYFKGYLQKRKASRRGAPDHRSGPIGVVHDTRRAGMEPAAAPGDQS